MMKDTKNEEAASPEKQPSESSFANVTTSQRTPQRQVPIRSDFMLTPPNANFTLPNVELQPSEMDNFAFSSGYSNQLLNMNPVLSSPYNQLNLCQVLSTYLNVYMKYLHFLHPYFKIPRDGATALSLISVPFDAQTRKEKIYNMALNTILALG
jgi:hypothetical protein